MNACEWTASITALANALACRLTEEELNLVAATLTQLGDTLITIAARKKSLWFLIKKQERFHREKPLLFFVISGLRPPVPGKRRGLFFAEWKRHPVLLPVPRFAG